MKILENKQILFFSPSFFGYEDKIKKKMEELGATVDMYDERSVTKSWQKALLKIVPTIFDYKTESYYFNILERIKNKQYDYILFVKCDMPTERVLSRYKENFKDSKMCLYLWDSVRNIPNIKKKLKYFDLVSSFDRYDCLNYDTLNFRPLFYCDEYKRVEVSNFNYEYDLCFIGTIHSDRYKILEKIEKAAKEQNLNTYIYPYLQSKFIYYFYKVTKKEFRKTKITDFKFTKLSSQEIANIIDKSKIVIDIQHPNQTGLTMRTIEMFGMNKKLITSNEDIVNYDFYNEHNIKIIHRSEKKICLDSLNDDYENIENSIYSFYSIENWIIDVIGFEKTN